MPETAEFKIEGEQLAEEDSREEGLEEEESAKQELDEAESALQPIQATQPEEKLDALRVVEAAMFLANKKLAYAELAIMAKTQVRKTKELVEKLAGEYEARNGSVEVVFDAEGACLQVKPQFLSSVSALSKQVELTRKSSRMLALVAKKGRLLQSELRKYFRGGNERTLPIFKANVEFSFSNRPPFPAAHCKQPCPEAYD